MDIDAVNTILYCTRWRDCVGFYRDGLGLTVGFENDWFVEFTVNDGARISVADASRASIASVNGDGLTLTFEVSDVKAARASLVARGLEPDLVSRHPWGALVFYLRDPEDHRIEFWSREDQD